MNLHKCPQCGKEMAEGKSFPGVWVCPDYSTAINDAPPYIYKCTGIEITDQAVTEFLIAMQDRINRRN